MWSDPHTELGRPWKRDSSAGGMRARRGLQSIHGEGFIHGESFLGVRTSEEDRWGQDVWFAGAWSGSLVSRWAMRFPSSTVPTLVLPGLVGTAEADASDRASQADVDVWCRSLSPHPSLPVPALCPHCAVRVPDVIHRPQEARVAARVQRFLPEHGLVCRGDRASAEWRRMTD